ncbi:MAG: alanine--tRNA ligase [Candidatus Nealsonbacteria bacterium]
MTSNKLREAFLRFFEKNGHKIVPSFSLLPTDPSVLFTTAGMQQFKKYFLGKKSLYGLNAASCQKCFRTSDIDEVGDERHLTFFEMLGNFSFGGYEKEKAIKLAKDFLDSINIKIDYVTVFEGDENVPCDEESVAIWQKLGIGQDKIKKCAKEDNFWGPTGEEGPCGPTTEIYAQGIEIWNIVFNQYYCHQNKTLTKLESFGVDTGMGLERLAMISQGKSSVFEADLFLPIIDSIPCQDEKAKRIIADHIKSAVFLIADGILPSNVEQGYILRRILRRAIRYGKSLDLTSLAQKVIAIYEGVYPELKLKETDILAVIEKEKEKFSKTLEEGLKQFEKGVDAFELYATYGFPVELTMELAKEKGIEINLEDFKKKFKTHQEVSRAGAQKKFKGGMSDHSEQTIKYHTAAHLMLAALREVLGETISQKGSNITAERLRFDFNYSQKMTDVQIKKVQDLVNQKIKEDLSVVCEEMALDEAKKKGAVGVFENKYAEKVKVYTIDNFSKEICGGPHVKKTGELGFFKIIKEESSSAGVRRIRGVLESTEVV